jgi:hypothetical protein
VARLPHLSNDHDPFWDMDGKQARHSRLRRRVVRRALLILVVLIAVAIAARLPAVDATEVITGYGRPILAGAIFAVLGVSVLLGLLRIRIASHRR